MARKFGLALLALLVLAVFSVGGAAGYLYINRAKVLVWVQQLVADQFTTRVTFSDHIGIDVFSNFPRMGIELHDVFVQGAHGTDTLLHARSLAASVHLLDLITGKGINITGLTASNGKLNVVNTKKGWSYEVFKPSTDRDTTAGADIDRVRLHNMDVLFATGPTRVALAAHQAQIDGHVLAAERNLDLDMNLGLKLLSTSGFSIDTLVPIETTAKLTIARGAKMVAVDNGYLALNGARVKWSGHWEMGKTTQTDMIFETEGLEVNRILPLWKNQPNALRELKPTGHISAKIGVNGPLGGKHGPKLAVHGEAKNLTLNTGKTMISLSGKDIDLSMTDALDLGTFSAKIKLLEVKMGRSEAEADLILTNLKNPEYDLSAKGELNLTDLIDLMGNAALTQGSGNLTFDIQSSGKLSGTTNLAQQLAHQPINLQAQVSKAGVVVNGLPEIAGVNGHIAIDKQGAVQIDLKSAAVGSLDLSANLKAQGAIEALLGGANLTTLGGNMTIGRLDVRQVGREWVSQDPDKNKNSSAQTLPVQLDLNLTIDQLIYDDFSADHVRGRLFMDQNGLAATNLRADCLGGSVEAQLRVTPTQNQTHVVLAATVSDLDIQRTFREWANFGQTAISHQNLRGTATADMLIELTLGPDLAIMPNAIVADADLTVKNGALVNFAPLRSLSKFIDVSELDHVKFDDLSNRLTIRQGKLSIPYMTVKTSALTLDVYGEQDFKGEMDYHVNLLLSEVLGRKARKKQPQEFEGHAIVEEEGKTRLFLWVRGTPNDVKVGFDKKEVRKKVAKEMKTEGETLRQLFKDEFKKKHTDTLRTSAPRPADKKPKPASEGSWGIEF